MLKAWLPALSGTACLGFGAGLIGVFGFFVPFLSEEFGVGVASLNVAPAALLLMPGLIAPFVGKLVDRTPIRRLILTGATFAMASLLVVSQAPTILIAGLAFLCFAAGLTLYGPVVVNGMLVKLYPGREARALGIAAMGISVATAILPPLVGQLLIYLSWRGALAVLALGILVLLWALVLLGIPATAGREPEAAPGNADSGVDRNANFWLIGICIAMGFCVAILLAICYPPHFISQGYTMAQAAWFVSIAGMSGFVGKACVAALGDAVHRYAKWLAAGLLLIQAVGLLLLLEASSSAEVLPIMFILGFGGGGFLPMHGYLNSQYFSAEVIGQVSGAQMPLFLPLGLLGPPLAGWAFDQTGHYEQVLLALVAILLLSMIFALALPGKTR